MTTYTMKFFSAAVLAAALIATVAIARTVHSHAGTTAAAPPAHTHTHTMRSMPADAAPLRGSIACATMTYADCRELEQMLPM